MTDIRDDVRAGFVALYGYEPAVCSGVTSPIQAPMAASDPARYLSVLSARRGEVT
jgi:hypothetical protein